MIKNLNLQKKIFFDGVPLKGYIASKLFLGFTPKIEKKKHCGNIQWLMMLKFQNMKLFSITSSSDVMFEALSVYFQHVNERAAHVKINRISHRCRAGL